MPSLCESTGNTHHQIESLKKEEGVDPTSKQIVSAYWLGCTRCGMALEEIRGPQKKTRTRKPKQVQETDPSKLD